MTHFSAADSAVDERKLLPGSAGDPKVVPGGIDDPEVRQAPRTILEILFKRSPSRHGQIAFTGASSTSSTRSAPAGGSRAGRTSRTALRAAPTLTAPRCIDTYPLG